MKGTSMTLRQRALLNTVRTVLGVTAIGFLGGFISTFMTQIQFLALLTAILFGFFCYIVYTWNITSLEMDERFESRRREQ